MLTEFCMDKRKTGVLWDWPRDKVTRFVAFCFYNGKMAFSFDNDRINAVIFYWPDHMEHVEMRHEQKRPQFEWEPAKRGDVLFFGDCIGTRASISRLYTSLVQKYPQLSTVPVMTYRHGKLITFSKRLIERFCQ